MASNNMKNTVIINVGVDYWYEKGSKRLRESLIENGFDGDLLIDIQYPAHSPKHSENPYAFKVYQFEKALALGYKKIFWMDCSIISSPDPNRILQIMNEQSCYFVKNGQSVGQETNDFTLDYFGVSRDEAMDMPQVCSGFFGLDFNKIKCRNIYRRWKEACEAGCFKGNRNHDENDSKDPRFLWHRQDQSSLSLAIYTTDRELKNIYSMSDSLTYDYKNKTDLFICHGM